MTDTNHCVKLAALFTSSTYKLYTVDIVQFTNGETFFERAGPVSFNGTKIVRHVFLGSGSDAAAPGGTVPRAVK